MGVFSHRYHFAVEQRWFVSSYWDNKCLNPKCFSDLIALSSKKDIKESYDALGGRIYDIRYLEEQVKKYDTIVNRIPSSDEDLVLDIGCGTGLLLEKIAATSVGVDLSINLLEKALERNKYGRVYLVQADAESLPFRDAVFDQVYSITVLQNLNNQPLGLIEVKRVSGSDPDIVVTGLKKAYSKESFSSLLSEAGFTIELHDIDELNDFVAFLRKRPD